ncbi:MAG TPA: 16S rRNA (cytosine(1402)-N(4))-methyltransferase, partial [Acidobacteria bacterium]|nr:16S rRNA (cytosine(1402)-N(4))-methyltransferase [Acidobacteriota bacterium]
MTNTTVHQAVLTAEVLTFLAPQRGGLFVDCTVGLGGHARVLLEHGASRVIGLDRDREALSQAHTALSAWAEHVELHHANYKDVDAVLNTSQISSVDGVLADLGVSSLHLDGEGRGFSFRRDEPLDMRMDQSAGQTAADLIRNTSEQALADIIFKYGEERQSRRIARAIVEARRTSPVTSTGDLASIVRRSLRRRGYTRIDPATRTFQAIRIWVNQELEGLEVALEAMCRRLR